MKRTQRKYPLHRLLKFKFKRNIKPSELKPVTDYIKGQGRFKHLNPEKNPKAQVMIDAIQDRITKRWAELEKLENGEYGRVFQIVFVSPDGTERG